MQYDEHAENYYIIACALKKAVTEREELFYD